MHDETKKTWLLIAVGCVFLLLTAREIFLGRMTISFRHRWGFIQNSDVYRDEAPLPFWIKIFMQILVAGGVLGYGIQRLVEGP